MHLRSTKIAALAHALLFLAGCGHGHGHGDHEDPAHAEHEAHQSHGPGLQLTLDDGRKWQVDEPTRESAAKIASLAADAESVASVEDARALGKALDEELDTLVRRCKMTGPAHDQLHVFLVALFPEVEALEQKTDLGELQAARAEIGELLEAYSTHFE